MKREMLERYLEQSERHVALGWRHIARQMDILAGLALNGRDTASARRLMLALEDLQEAQEARREMLERQLRKSRAGH